MGKKILLVEDEALIALNESKMLEKYGYEVVTAYNGEGAIEAVESDREISLILMDIDLGEGMDGTEAAEEILKKKDIPVVFLSSHTEPEVVEKTEKITSYGYVVKNSGATVLDASIKMAFKLYEAYVRYNQRNQELYALAEELEESNEELTCKEEELRKREASLAESDNRFRSVLQLVPDMISIHDPDMNILYSNWRSFAEVPEGKRLLHTKCYKTYRDLDEICPDCLAKTVLETGRPMRREAELPEGMWVDIRAIPVLDAKNRVSMFVEWVRDITEDKLIQKKLKLSEEEYRRFFETMSLGVVYQAADGTISSANPAAEKILGLTLDQMTGKTSMDPRWKMLNEQGEEVPGSEHPAMQALRTGKKVGPVDRSVFIPEKKQYVWLSITAIPLFHPGDNSPYQVYATFEDITERKRAEDKLKENNNLLERIFDNNIDLISLTDLEGNYKVAGKAHGILGYDIGYLIGKNVMDFVHPEDISYVMKEFAEFLQIEETRKVEYRYKRIDGEYLWFETTGTILKNKNGTPEQILFNTRDITERKQAENRLRESEATVKNKLKAILEPDGDIETLNLEDIIDCEALQTMMEDKIKHLLSEKEILLREVHHRIKNSMSQIESFLSLQADSTRDAVAKTALRQAISRVGSIRVLYEKLLFGEEYRDVSIKEYAESLIDSLVTVFSELNNVTIERRIADFSLSSKKTIPVGIIINELLTNVFKYAFQGRDEGHILIELRRSDNKVSLTIQDDGVGIDKEVNANNSTGFGLTIVKMLAEQLDGNFSTENENGTKSLLKFEIE